MSRIERVSTTCGSGWVSGKAQRALSTVLQAASLQMCSPEYLPRSKVALHHGEQASSLFYNVSWLVYSLPYALGPVARWTTRYRRWY